VDRTRILKDKERVLGIDIENQGPPGSKLSQR
jgi:hypothetical protein